MDLGGTLKVMEESNYNVGDLDMEIKCCNELEPKKVSHLVLRLLRL